MSYRLPPLNALRAFEAAARHLSFKRAADELAVTPTAVSHQIRGLEDYLGFPLFVRRTRAIELSNDGRAMLAKVREGLECFAAAIERTRRHAAGGRLLVASPPAFATRWLIRQLPSFTRLHPEVQLHMSATLQTIDPPDAGSVSPFAEIDVRADESEVAVRFGHGRYPGCRVDRLFAPAYTPVCSPRLATAERPLATIDDLAHHSLLHDDTIPELMDRPSWGEWLAQAGAPSTIDPDAGPRFSDPGLVLSAAIDGLGVALASTPLVDAEIEAGRLIAPFKLVIERPQAYFLVSPEASAERPTVRAFRAWLLTEARQTRRGD